MSRGMTLSHFYKSFSGTDTVAFLLFPGVNPIVIGSLTTVSYSMYRNKVPVINIGRTNINGITRGSRIYAGTMVFTLINKHWVRELQDQAEYLKDFPTLKTDELPLFDIMIVSANEYGSSCSMFIYGVDLTDEAQTLSIEDLFTENVFKFVAREVSVFDENIITVSDIKPKKYYTITTEQLTNYYTDEQERQSTQIINNNKPEIRSLDRNLYYIHERPMIGNDVAAVQQLLIMAMPNTNLQVTYKYDELTETTVKEFQTMLHVEPTGIVDNMLYSQLLEYNRIGVENEFVQVINKSGAYVYKNPDENSEITKILPYLSTEEVFNKITKNAQQFYQVQDGYVSTYDVYNLIEPKNNDFTYETLEYMNEGPQVTILQDLLHEYYPEFDHTTGIYDEITENFVKRFQREHDLLEIGKCDYPTWNELLRIDDRNYKQYITNHTKIDYDSTTIPGRYTINDINQLSDFTCIITNNNTQQAKITALALYENDKSKTMSDTLTFNGSKEIIFNDYEDMFKSDPQYGQPYQTIINIYPFGENSYQWIFDIKEGE